MSQLMNLNQCIYVDATSAQDLHSSMSSLELFYAYWISQNNFIQENRNSYYYTDTDLNIRNILI